MKDYTTLIVTASLAISMLRGLFPKAYEKFGVSFTVKLILVVLVLSPIINTTKDFINYDNLFVINVEEEHNINNEDGDLIWKKTLAQTTAERVSNEIEESLLYGLGIRAEVVVPWHTEENNIIFETLEIYPQCSEDKFKQIENYISIHFELSSKCKKG